MTNREIEQRLQHGFSQTAPKTLSQDVFEACVPSSQSFAKPKRPIKLWQSALAVAAAVALIAMSAWMWAKAPTPTVSVSLDVNPSITFEIDEHNTVVAVNALNEDGTIIVGDNDWKGKTAQEVVDVLVAAMLQNGYLNDSANSILISVDGTDDTQAIDWEQKLAAYVQGALKNDQFEGAVISQTLSPDDDLKQQAARYGISYGKAMLIQRIIELDPLKTFDNLAALAINDLNLLCNTAQMPHVHGSGKASEKAYIGEQAALQEVLTQSGIALENMTRLETEFDCEDGVMCYEIEFVYDGNEYEYEINALTGDVMKAETELAENNDDHDDDDEVDTSSDEYVPQDEIKKTVFAHAGVSETAVTDFDIEADKQNGLTVYEIEFQCDGTEYEYLLDAVTGEILHADQETDDE